MEISYNGCIDIKATMKSPTQITINVKDELKKAFKLRCLINDRDMTKVLIDFIQAYSLGQSIEVTTFNDSEVKTYSIKND